MVLLRLRDSGGEVRALHDNLRTLGYWEDFFDQRTKQAVVEFQRAVGLVPDGVVGEQTRGMLDAARRYIEKGIPMPVPGAPQPQAYSPKASPLFTDIPTRSMEQLGRFFDMATAGQWSQVLEGQKPTPQKGAVVYGKGRGLNVSKERALMEMASGRIKRVSLGDVPGVWVIACGPTRLGQNTSPRRKKANLPSFHCSSFVNFGLSMLLGLNENYTHPGNIPHLRVLAKRSVHRLNKVRVGKREDGTPAYAKYRGFGEHLARLAPSGVTAKRHKGLSRRLKREAMDIPEIWSRREELGTLTVFLQSTDTDPNKPGVEKIEHHVGFLIRLPQYPNALIRIAADGYMGSDTPINIEIIDNEAAMQMRGRFYSLFRVHSLPEVAVHCPITVEIP